MKTLPRRRPAKAAHEVGAVRHTQASALEKAQPVLVPLTARRDELKPQQRRGFSVTVGKDARLMQTPCEVSRCGDLTSGHGPEPVNALWDTGSSCCVITKRLANARGLRPTGKVRELIVNRGRIRSQTYFADLALPGGILFQNVEMLEGSFLPGIDVLIGLSVIRCGDLAVNSSSGESVFSFHTPAGLVVFDHGLAEAGKAIKPRHWVLDRIFGAAKAIR